MIYKIDIYLVKFLLYLYFNFNKINVFFLENDKFCI